MQILKIFKRIADKTQTEEVLENLKNLSIK